MHTVDYIINQTKNKIFYTLLFLSSEKKLKTFLYDICFHFVLEVFHIHTVLTCFIFCRGLAKQKVLRKKRKNVYCDKISNAPKPKFLDVNINISKS